MQSNLFAKAMARNSLYFRQLFDKNSSTYTYVLADFSKEGKPAVIIDPVDTLVERDSKLITELNLSLLYALNTHVHADHVTGTGLLKRKFSSAKSVISKSSGAKGDILTEHGQVIKFGQFGLEVRETPGHTSGCVTYVFSSDSDSAVPRMAFTGDALLIRGCGRTDFQGGDPRKLYKSVHSQIFSLPEDTLLYPAHDYKGFTVTTVKEEVKLNPRLTKSEGEFCEIMDNLGLAPPKLMAVAVSANLVCGIQDPVNSS